MSQPYTIFWFRQDLRLSDNPGLSAALERGPVLPIYILDTEVPALEKMGAASRFWLHHSLEQLNSALGGHLNYYQGSALDIITQLIQTHPIQAVYWNRCYEPHAIARDSQIKSMVQGLGLDCTSFNASLLWEPFSITKKDGQPYQVFSYFYHKGCLTAPSPRPPLPAPKNLHCVSDHKHSIKLSDFNLLPHHPWADSLAPHWTMGEAAAQAQLKHFLNTHLKDYAKGRDYPAQSAVSRLSPHLHFGEISPHQAWWAAKNQDHGHHQLGLERFLTELGWREFSYYLLYHYPSLPHQNFQAQFNHFPWKNNAKLLKAWQQGQTGYPLVDAGMRELWQTGYMHNRVRMVVGSFLVKNLLLHWHQGRDWFWDCLVDADLANNSASWQWVAGSGADAAPYFRIFNPVLQGQKFDPTGEYTRRFVPELGKLPLKYLFNPWEAPTAILKAAGLTLGQNYPHPIVDLASSRDRALSAYQQSKKA